MTNTTSLQDALNLLVQTQDQEKIDEGFSLLQELTDYMTAAAFLGDSCRFKHLGHYDLEMCR